MGQVVPFPFEQVYKKRGGGGLGFNPLLNTLTDAELVWYYDDAVTTLWEYESLNEYGIITPEDVRLAKRMLRDIPKSLISRNKKFYVDEFSQLHITKDNAETN